MKYWDFGLLCKTICCILKHSWLTLSRLIIDTVNLVSHSGLFERKNAWTIYFRHDYFQLSTILKALKIYCYKITQDTYVCRYFACLFGMVSYHGKIRYKQESFSKDFIQFPSIKNMKFITEIEFMIFYSIWIAKLHKATYKLTVTSFCSI